MSTARNAKHTVRIDWPFGAEPPALYCPRSGVKVLSAEDSIDYPASPYVTFVYIWEISEFAYLREDLKERLEAAKQKLIDAGTDEDDINDVDVLLEHTDLGEVPVVYEVYTHGMACGPVSYCVQVGFDLWSGADEA